MRSYRQRNREKLRRQNREYMRARRQLAEPPQPGTACLACGAPLAPSLGYKPRKWCNQNCAHWASRHPGEIRRADRACVICNADLSALQYKAEVCSTKCRNIKDGRAMRERNLAIARTCAWCAGEFHCVSPMTKCCSVSCAQKRRFSVRDEAARRELALERTRRKNRKRRHDGIISEPYTVAGIAERDGYRCGVCRRKVDMGLSGLHPRGPTIDHIVPLVISRDDTRTNVQLAHRDCNMAKWARDGGQQLLLIG